MGHGLDDGRRTGDSRWWVVVELSSRARRVREREREGSAEGPSERGKVGEQGAGLKMGEDVQRWPGISRSWACPRLGIVGGRLRMN
jgi:hypothetical protein